MCDQKSWKYGILSTRLNTIVKFKAQKYMRKIINIGKMKIKWEGRFFFEKN